MEKFDTFACFFGKVTYVINICEDPCMNVITATHNTLVSLIDFLTKIDPVRYKTPVDLFNGSTLGEHTRHVIEFYQCIQKHAYTGVINYDRRDRDRHIQEDPEMAMLAVKRILEDLQVINLDEEIVLEVAYDKDSTDTDIVRSNIKREIAYNLEHAIHHMALIKVGVKVLQPDMILDEEFGVAPSTIKYKQGVCAQ